MVIWEITPVEGSFGEFGELAHRVLLKMPMSGLPEDAIERFFEKSSEKR